MPLDYSTTAESVKSRDNPGCCIHDHSTIPSGNHIMNRKLDTERTTAEKPVRSKQKEIPEKSSLQVTSENQHNQGLTIYIFTPREG